MWTRKELKKNAKEIVKKNYWTAVIVCFLIALLTGEFGTSIIGFGQTPDSMDPYYIVREAEYFAKDSLGISYDDSVQENINDKTVEDKEIDDGKKLFDLNIKNVIRDVPSNVLKTIDANLNSATKSQRYIFKIWDAINLFGLNKSTQGVILCIAAALALLFTIFVADPMIVGGKRYFINAKNSSNTKISEMFKIFREGNWLNVVKIMFLRNIYTFLWYLTIIGGIIKTYEYRMIPYLLAENPKIEKKEAFLLSKQMMQGNKWRTFILDMSFFFWNLLSVLTFGLLGIFWVNPYNSATIAELYIYLKNKKK